MKRTFREAGRSLAGLFSFIYWYAVVITLFLYVLPSLGLFIESKYDALSGVSKVFLILGFIGTMTIWQILSTRRGRINRPGRYHQKPSQ